MGGTCSADGGQERHIKDIGGKTCGKGPIGRPRRRWENKIKMDL
jgi:hypothetical protein